MKKLSVVLLAIVFIVGLAVQPVAAFDWVTDKTVFDGDDLIDFNNVETSVAVGAAYFSYGVESIVGYGDSDSNLTETYFESDSVTNLFLLNPVGGSSHPAIRVNFVDTITRVGFNAAPPSFPEWNIESIITVKAFRDGALTDEKDITVGLLSDERFIGIEDLDGIDAVEISGNIQVATNLYLVYIDNLTFGGTLDAGPIDVNVEIRPPNCLGAKIPIDGKKINAKSKGVTPVVIVGNPTYDVTEIDPATVLLQGVAPVRDAIEYASHCNAENGDDELDLVLKFSTQELVDAMEISPAERKAVENGEWPSKPLQLTGNLFEDSGGTAINGEVSVTLVGKLKPARENRGEGSTNRSDRYQRFDRGHHHGWHKSNGQHKHKGWDKD